MRAADTVQNVIAIISSSAPIADAMQSTPCERMGAVAAADRSGRARPRWLPLLGGPRQPARDSFRGQNRTAPLEDVVELVTTGKARRVLVVKDGQLIGVVSRADLLCAIAREPEMIPPAVPPDYALAEQVVALLRQQEWDAHSRVTVMLADGVVYLETSSTKSPHQTGTRSPVQTAVTGRGHCDYFDPSTGLVYGF